MLIQIWSAINSTCTYSRYATIRHDASTSHVTERNQYGVNYIILNVPNFSDLFPNFIHRITKETNNIFILHDSL